MTRGDKDDDAYEEEQTAAFVIHGKHAFCPECDIKLHRPKCKGCRKPIRSEDEALEALKAKWHRACFKCTVSANLDDLESMLTDSYLFTFSLATKRYPPSILFPSTASPTVKTAMQLRRNSSCPSPPFVRKSYGHYCITVSIITVISHTL